MCVAYVNGPLRHIEFEYRDKLQREETKQRAKVSVYNKNGNLCIMCLLHVEKHNAVMSCIFCLILKSNCNKIFGNLEMNQCHL